MGMIKRYRYLKYVVCLEKILADKEDLELTGKQASQIYSLIQKINFKLQGEKLW